jgi:hypothetical protein
MRYHQRPENMIFKTFAHVFRKKPSVFHYKTQHFPHSPHISPNFSPRHFCAVENSSKDRKSTGFRKKSGAFMVERT